MVADDAQNWTRPIGWYQEKTDYVRVLFERAGGGPNSVLGMLAAGLQRGVRDYHAMMREVVETAMAALPKAGIRVDRNGHMNGKELARWSSDFANQSWWSRHFGTRAELLTVSTPDATQCSKPVGSMKLDRAQLMKLVLIARDDRGVPVLTKGGFVFEHTLNKPPIVIGGKSLAEIVGAAYEHSEVITMVDARWEWDNGPLAEYIDTFSERVFGYKKSRKNRTTMPRHMGGDKIMDEEPMQWMAKTATDGERPVVLKDGVIEWFEHTHQIAYMVSLYEAVRDARRILKLDNVAQALKDNFGPRYYGEMLDAIDDIEAMR